MDPPGLLTRPREQMSLLSDRDVFHTVVLSCLVSIVKRLCRVVTCADCTVVWKKIELLSYTRTVKHESIEWWPRLLASVNRLPAAVVRTSAERRQRDHKGTERWAGPGRLQEFVYEAYGLVACGSHRALTATPSCRYQTSTF